MKKNLVAFVVFAMFILVSVLPAFAQSDDQVNSSLESLRADLRADRVSIIKDAMQFTAAEADAFWPVYRSYDKELTALNDQLVTLIKSYSDKFGSITNAEATSMAEKTFDLQSKRTQLKRKYFPLFAKATSPLTAAKFFQLEYRLELLLNLRITSELPSLLIQAAPATTPKQK